MLKSKRYLEEEIQRHTVRIVKLTLAFKGHPTFKLGKVNIWINSQQNPIKKADWILPHYVTFSATGNEMK